MAELEREETMEELLKNSAQIIEELKKLTEKLAKTQDVVILKVRGCGDDR